MGGSRAAVFSRRGEKGNEETWRKEGRDESKREREGVGDENSENIKSHKVYEL